MPLIENKELSYSFLKELCNLIFFWISGVCFFLFFRISFIFLYRFDLTENLPISEFIKTLYMGFRFDSTVVSFFLIIPFLALYVLPILNKEKYLTTIRIAFQYIFIITSTILCIINLNFYKEFKNQLPIGVCHPGIHSPQTGLVKNAPNCYWIEKKPFQSDLRKALSKEVYATSCANINELVLSILSANLLNS